MEERILQIRQDNNLTQQEFADMINVSQPAVLGYEKGQYQPDLSVLIRMAQLFHVSIEYIVGLVDYKNPPYETPELNNLERALIDNFKSFSPALQQKLVAVFDEMNRDRVEK